MPNVRIGTAFGGVQTHTFQTPRMTGWMAWKGLNRRKAEVKNHLFTMQLAKQHNQLTNERTN